MTHQDSDSPVSLLDAARAVARGGDLDSRLTLLASHASASVGGGLAAIFLFDDATGQLVPAASDGSDGTAISPIDLEATIDPIRTAMTDIVPQRFGNEPDTVAMLPFLPLGTRGIFAIPLLTTSDEGEAEVDGLLLATTAEDVESPSESLLAIADLAAVAIRQTRLQNALHERVDWMDRMANTDPLTGLANRRTFDRMLELELARAGRQGATVGLLLFSVDGLGEARDRLGDAGVDDVLRRVAATLANELRLIDTVARIGPDLFAGICPGSPGPEAALRVRTAVSQQRLSSTESPEGPIALAMGVTVGVARFPDSAADAMELVAAAEAALAGAYAHGAGSVIEAGAA
ncbi:MAG: GGDEF domain-containing protein, partial [Candidatus Limnocylindrales bacterium]